MNRIFKVVCMAALAFALTTGPAGVAFAQQGGGSGTTGGGTAGGTTSGGTTSGGTTSDTRSDRGFDLGWLGLFGLAGLVPLFMNRRNGHETSHSSMATGNAAR